MSALENCTLPEELWTHRAHVRTAFVYASRHDLETATRQMKQSLISYNQATGTPESLGRGYHETITVAFMRLIHAANKLSGPHRSSAHFCTAHPELMTKNVLKTYYSRDRLVNSEAKASFVAPDRRPLP